VPFTAACLATAASLALLAVLFDRFADDFARLEAGVFAVGFLRVVDFDDARPFVLRDFDVARAFVLRDFDDARPLELRDFDDARPLELRDFDDARPFVLRVLPFRAVERPLEFLVLVVWAIRALLPNPLQNGHTRRRGG
jgi:hypothetical protein